MRSIFALILFVALSALGALSGCGAPTPDASTAIGKRQIIDQANKALTTSDCGTALTLLLPVYKSANSDNEIRLLTASAYACWANINFFKLVGDIVTHSPTLATSGFWSYTSSLFPSTIGQDHVAEGALLGTDALMASLKSGLPILPSGLINPGTFNIGSVYGFDRVDDANIYLIFTAMAGIGSLQNRYGNPDPVFRPQVPLPWTSADKMTTDGAGYASSIVNFVDAIGLAKNILPSNLSNTLTSVQSTFSLVIDLACDYGCTGNIPPKLPPYPAGEPPLNLNGNWVTSKCNFASGCTPDRKCPASLKDRTRVTAQTTDVNSCAAAGIVNLINYSPVGWQ